MINIIDSLSIDDVLLVPKYSDISSRQLVNLSVDYCKGFSFALPFVPSNMRDIMSLDMARSFYERKSLSIFHRFATFEEQLDWLKEIKTWENGTNYVGFSVGVKDEDYSKVDVLVESGAKIINVDVAHGHSAQCIKMTRYIAEKYPHVLLISGNVSTGEGSVALWSAGADIVKVGIGQGCFAAGTKVLMSNGQYKNIEDVVPGDKVINKNGKVVKVKNSFSTGLKKVYQLNTKSWYQDTLVTPDHLFYVKESPKKLECKWKSISEVDKEEFLVPSSIDFEIENDFSIDLSNKYHSLQLKPSYDLGYVFGSYLRCGFTLPNEKEPRIVWGFDTTLDEEDQIKKAFILYKVLQKCFPKWNISKLKYDGEIIITLFSKELAEFFVQWKEFNKKIIPYDVIVNHKSYLQGIVDSSESIPSDDNFISVGSFSKNMVERYNLIFYLLKGKFPSNNSIPYDDLGGEEAYIITNDSLYLEKIGKDKTIVSGDKISFYECDGMVETFDLEIDDDTHSFIANNMIVHNSICTTRVNTGNGIPTITSLSLCSSVKQKTELLLGRKLFLMQDGGCATPGAVAKCLCFADIVMCGNLFAGTDEAAGSIVIINDVKYKQYNGSSTHKENHKEGVEALKKAKGPVSKVIESLCDGIKSCCSYQGVMNTRDLKTNPQFVKVSHAGHIESGSHDLDIVLG